MKINFVNADHVHALIDLPTNLSIEEVMQLFKGGSSHWINESHLVTGKFGWGRGYGVFSVSESGVAEVCAYIANQEEHHRKRDFVRGIEIICRAIRAWSGAKIETVETVSIQPGGLAPR